MSARRRKTKDVPVPGGFRIPAQTGHSRDLVKLFDNLQMDDMSTGKAVIKLKKLYDSAEKASQKENFFEHLVFMLQVPLVNGSSKEKPNKYDEKMLQVISRFAAASLNDKPDAEDEDGIANQSMIELPWILRQTFDWLLDHHEVRGSGARLRICMMINWLLKNLGLQAEIDEVLYQKIFDNMMERLQDKVSEIRAQAVTALQRLQDPTDPDCPIIQAYLFHLRSDPSSLVRRTVIKCIGAARHTLQPVLQRTKDVDELVRKAAYKFIADKVSFKPLKISQREELLRQGLADRSPAVQKVVAKELIPSWLRICNESVVELFHSLDVGNSDGKTATEICKVTFAGVPYDQLTDGFKYLDPTVKLVPLSKLTPETVTYWKNLVMFFFDEAGKEENAEQADDHLEKLLPELTFFCSYVRDYITNFMGKIQRNDNEDTLEEDVAEADAFEVAGYFVAKQLIEMTAYFDYSDEVGRHNLLRLCKDLLANRRLHAGFVEPIMKIYNFIQKNVDERIREIAEIISDLRDPLTVATQHLPQSNHDSEKEKEDEEKDEEENEMMEESIYESVEFTEQEKEDMMKKAAAEAKRNEEALRKKRVELAKIRLKLNILKDELDTAVEKQEFVEAQELKLQFDAISEQQRHLLTEIESATAVTLTTPKEATKKRKVIQKPRAKTPPPPPCVETQVQSQVQSQSSTQRDNPEMVLKCLTMLSDLMRSQDIENLNPTLQSLLDEFIVPAIRNMNFAIREAAVKAMGCACLRSLRAAKQLLLVILQMAHLDSVEVRVRAVQVVVDLLMWHGLTAFISDSQDDDLKSDDGLSSVSQEVATQFGNLTQAELNSQGGNSVVTVLCQLLDDPDSEIRTLVAEGLCKLILCGSITSHKLFTRLVLMWANPINETNTKIKNILGVFFPLYASLSRANQDTIEESFLGTMKTLMDAPETSPLAMVNVEDIGLFYVQLTRPSTLQDSCRSLTALSNVHDALAFTISNFIISSPDSFYLKYFAKFLGHLEITPSNFTQLRELKDLYDQMTETTTDKFILKSLERFGLRLEEYIKLDPEAKENEQPNEEEAQEKPKDGATEPDLPMNELTDQGLMTMNGTKFGAKKRTLFSQTQNTLLDMSIGSPATFAAKSRFFSSTQRNPENFNLSVSIINQATSSQHANVFRPTQPEQKRPDGAGGESSDSEVEFKRPTKIVRLNEKSPVAGGADNLSDSDDEIIVSGILKNRTKSKPIEETSDSEVEFRQPSSKVSRMEEPATLATEKANDKVKNPDQVYGEDKTVDKGEEPKTSDASEATQGRPQRIAKSQDKDVEKIGEPSKKGKSNLVASTPGRAKGKSIFDSESDSQPEDHSNDERKKRSQDSDDKTDANSSSLGSEKDAAGTKRSKAKAMNDKKKSNDQPQGDKDGAASANAEDTRKSRRSQPAVVASEADHQNSLGKDPPVDRRSRLSLSRKIDNTKVNGDKIERRASLRVESVSSEPVTRRRSLTTSVPAAAADQLAVAPERRKSLRGDQKIDPPATPKNDKRSTSKPSSGESSQRSTSKTPAKPTASSQLSDGAISESSQRSTRKTPAKPTASSQGSDGAISESSQRSTHKTPAKPTATSQGSDGAISESSQRSTRKTPAKSTASSQGSDGAISESSQRSTRKTPAKPTASSQGSDGAISESSQRSTRKTPAKPTASSQGKEEAIGERPKRTVRPTAGVGENEGPTSSTSSSSARRTSRGPENSEPTNQRNTPKQTTSQEKTASSRKKRTLIERSPEDPKTSDENGAKSPSAKRRESTRTKRVLVVNLDKLPSSPLKRNRKEK